MSTRGFVGFKTNTENDREGNIFGIYNHYDSYYSHLGLEMLMLYEKKSKKEFQDIFNKIEWLTNSKEDIRTEWEELFDGEPKRVPNDANFLNDGLFCEYAYVYNLENDRLEVYRGFYKKAQSPELEKYGYESYDNTFYHTHKVFEVTRELDWQQVVDMFTNADLGDFEEDVENNIYAETIYMS